MASAAQKQARSFLAGIVVVAVFAAIIYVAATAHSGLPFQPSTKAKLAFANVGTLRAGDDVKQNSVRIGQVSNVQYVHGHAVVTVAISSGIKVYKNARAFIDDQSALAKHFVELAPGTPQAGSLGDRVLPGTRTMRATDLQDVLQVFNKKTRDRLKTAVGTLGGGAAGHSQDLYDLMTNAPGLLNEASTVLQAMTTRDARLPDLLNQVDVLAGQFQGHVDDVRRTVRQLAPTLEAVDARDGAPLGQTIHDLPGTLARATSGLGGLNPALVDARRAVHDLRPGAQALGRATPALRGFLRESVSPLRKLPGVARQAVPALADLSTTMRDARPFAPPLSHALTYLERPLMVLAPYSHDIMIFFSRADSLVSTTTPTGDHMARLGVGVPGLQIVDGSVLPNLTNFRVPYPAPGTEDNYKARGVAIPTGGSR